MKRVSIITKRIILTVLSVTLLILPIFISKTFNTKYEEGFNNNGKVVFNNDFDESDLEEPNVDVEDFIDMTTIYNKLLSDRIKNGTNSIDNTLKNDLEGLIEDKRITISSADELYYFANALSINFNSQGGVNTFIYNNTIEYLMSRDYVLLNDIDYSVKRAQKFVPIGTNINLEETSEIDSNDLIYLPFTGSFDGNGFEIKNLFLAEYSYITTSFEDEGESSRITVSLFKHYSMFSVLAEDAKLKNFVLKDPILEVATLDATSGLFNTSILVGENNGVIENVGVIDEKKTQAGLDNSGIIFNVAYPSNELYKASGFVFKNNGEIYNSYFVSKRVIASQSETRFNNIYPFVYKNDGTIENVSYNDDIILKNDDNKPNIGSSMSSEDIKVDTSLNTKVLDNNNLKWHFYKEDGYPSLKGLEFNGNNFEIDNEYDLLYFSYMINLASNYNNKDYSEHKYVLTNSINMKNIKSFKTINKEFKGEFLGNNKYIYNITINKTYIEANSVYLGLFSKVSGKIKDLMLLNNKVDLTDSKDHYGKVFHVGMIAGKLLNGEIINVKSDSLINLGNEAIGTTYAGGIVGLAKGRVDNIYVYGKIDGGSHDFNNHSIHNRFYVGGVIGSNNGELKINKAMNKAEVLGVGSKNINYNSSTTIKTFTGGIIGEVNNINKEGNSLVYLTNEGNINSNRFDGKTNTANVEQYVGGIFGSTKGYGYKLNDGNNVRNGRLENNGNVEFNINEFNNTKIFSAGIGVMNTNEEYAKISYIINNGIYESNEINNKSTFNYQTVNKNIYYASTVVDNSSGGVELSRAYNTKGYTLNGDFFDSINNLNNPSELKLSFFFTTVNDNPSRLLYVENRGGLTVGSTSNTTNIRYKLKVSNITQATKVDYKNVVNSGNINILSINNNSNTITNGTENSVYVSGISWILPFINRAYKMENILNEGNIIVADFQSNTTVRGSVTGPSFRDRTFSANLNVKNLYVSGIVNLNVGKIINSFNLGNITSTYNSNNKDISGTANTFVGGINTFNYNLIQDSANSGLIEFTNSNSSSVSHFAATTNISTTNNSTFGGISITYTGGIVLGGISAALGDISGTELEGFKTGAGSITAQVIDNVNNGDIFGKAREYVRSGGVLGIALGVELASGTYENKNSGISAGPFTTAVIGSGDPVGESLLSNGLNYGNISAVTIKVGNYGTNFGTGNGSNQANAIRPGIHAVAGGVIAYGLTEMVRMVNHGVIASTDAAGGIIGATYILGGTSQSNTPITEVNISTAVNYGKIKAVKIGSYNNSRVFQGNNNLYNNFTYVANENYNNTNKYYSLNEYGDYIYYRGNSSNNYIETYQQARRGFGGIFGRLQRGNFGTMKATSFKNVMNMDEDIDFVGRVDSNQPGSLVYYRFFDGEETYYSARKEDKSPNAFVGWYTNKEETFTLTNASVEFDIGSSSSGWSTTYYVRSIRILSNPSTATRVDSFTKVKTNVNSSSRSTYTKTNPEVNVDGYILQGNTNRNAPFRVSDFGLGNINSTGVITRNNYSRTFTLSVVSGGSTSDPSTNSALRYPVNHATDNPNDDATYHIFDENFPLMASENSEYIYPVEEDALAERFQTGNINEKPNGMYVLASSKGSIVGSSLPTNINIINLFKLKESEELEYINLDEDIASVNLVSSSDSADLLKDKYAEMFQLSYNDKSEILAEDEYPEIGSLTLYDPSGNSPTLTGGEINHNNRTITYEMDSRAFGNTINYEVLENELSTNAVISKTGISNNEKEAFKLAYRARENEIIKEGNYKFSYAGSFNGNQTTFNLSVYAELGIEGPENILEKYNTTYTIIINKKTSGNIGGQIYLDNVRRYNSNNAEKNITTTGSLSPNGTLRAEFTDNNKRLPTNHEIAFKGLYTTINGSEYEVDSNYYDLIINKKQGNNFGFEITLSDELIFGNYIIKYGYYSNQLDRSITFEKEASSKYDVTNISYNEFSVDQENTDFNFLSTNEDFNTFIKFGLEYNNVTFNEQDLTINEMLKVEESNSNYKAYINNTKYYELYLNGEYILTIELSPFTNLDNATIKYDYLSDGRKEYTIVYTVTSENNQNEEIVQKITERNVLTKDVYLNDNFETGEKIIITREALLSRVEIDYDFDNLNYYKNITFNVNNDTYSLEEIYHNNELSNMFGINITSLLTYGDYEINLKLTRDNNDYDLGIVNVEKLKGVSAYLQDIKFTQDDTDMIFEYPEIRPSDSNGVSNNDYDTRIYFDGIDYANADLNNYNNFRINGKVSDILLEEYSPRFTLPMGAKIYRNDSEEGWVETLETDFVGFLDEELEVVEYKIISEDESSEVHYFITAVDIKYNLTLRFKVYYEHDTLGLIEADDLNSPIKDEVLLIALKNMKLSDGTDYKTNSNDAFGFPLIDSNHVEGINNQSSLYYFVSSNTNYRFGRNMSGLFNFNIVTPKYKGPSIDNLTVNERHNYKMYMMPRGLDESDWYKEDYKLPDMTEIDQVYSGLQYFVYNPTANPMIRELAIVVANSTRDQKWGLNDDYASWD